MKILIAAGSYYNKNIPKFTKNKTGLGIMIKDILDYSSKHNDVYFLSKVITKKHIVKTCWNSYTILQHTILDIIFNIKPKDFLEALKMFFRYSQPIYKRFKFFYYFIDKGFIRNKISSLNPDLVHIHGIGYSTLSYIEICNELSVPYILTLHGVIGTNGSLNIPFFEKNIERTVLRMCQQNDIPVTIVSSGCKKDVIYNYSLNGDNISVILNGTNITHNNENYNKILYKKYEKYFNSNKKIITVIGNVCDRKNQLQIVEAWKKLNENEKNEIVIFFIGNVLDDGKLASRINELKANDNLIICGFIENNNLNIFYNNANLNVVASNSEGFGLSIIEAYSYGVPTAIFYDLDAVDDLYDKDAMIKIEKRTTEALSEGIGEGLRKIWNKEHIKKHAQKFSLDEMSKNYQLLYERVGKIHD